MAALLAAWPCAASAGDAPEDLVQTCNPEATFEERYIGRHDFSFTVPGGYAAVRQIEEGPQAVESVYLFRCKTPASTVMETMTGRIQERLYGPLGVVKLEAIPRTYQGPGEPTPTLQEMREQLSTMLHARGDPYAVHALELSRPAFQIDVVEEEGVVAIVVLEGKRLLYRLTAGKGDEVLERVVKSLSDE